MDGSVKVVSFGDAVLWVNNHVLVVLGLVN